MASTNGHLLVAELLIQYGADVNTRDRNRETPLHLASGHGKLDMVRLLLTSGSSVDSQDEDSTPLHRAAQSGHLDIVILLLRSGAGVNVHNSNDKTAKDLALDHGRLDVARCLTEWIEDVDGQNCINLASLDTASQDSLPSVARSSLGHGSEPNIPDERSTSLHDASDAGHIEIVRSLLEGGADVNERDIGHLTPLAHASRRGHLEVVKLLINYSSDVNSQDWIGWTALHIASRYRHVDVVHLLLDHGADVNAKRQDNSTPLHIAIENRSFEIVKALLEQGADVHVRNDLGQTPFQMASRRGEQDIVRLLSEYGAGK